MRLRENDPIFMAVKELDAHTVSVIPVFSDEGRFSGIVGIHEITRYFIESGLTERPVSPFRVENIEGIIPGEVLKRGKNEFSAPIMIDAMNVESSLARIDSCPEKNGTHRGQTSRHHRACRRAGYTRNHPRGSRS
jgi:CBS domain-containing protein